MNQQYFISNLVIIVNTFSVLALIATISQCCLHSPILCQSATNGMSKSMSHPKMAAPGEALSTV
jgi:hypothetical protein